MPVASSNNKRLAKNTLLLYFRMFLNMAIMLYTSRVVLRILGVEDYGIYNVVGGVVTMLNIITGALSITISRYITFELGRGDKKRLSTVFSTSVMIQVAMALFICIVAEIVGVWFLNAKMNIPVERMYAANWVLQCSIVTFMVNLVNIPYNATIIAHEKMSAFAYLSILEVSLKLAIVFLLPIFPFDKLIIYAILQLCVAISIRFSYGFYCQRHFSEAHFKFTVDKKLIREMFGLIGWAFWGNGAVILRDQGSNVLLNLFCGPAVNAARGVAVQVNTAVYSFTTNFLTALNPQITKSYSGGNLQYMHSLIIKGGKFGFFILLILLMPLCANIDYVLGLWLVHVPPHTAAFVVLTLLYSLFDCWGNPLVTGVLAEANIKTYEIILSLLYVTNIVSSYFFLKWGFEPEWVFILNIIFKAVIIGVLVWHSNRKYHFPVREFITQTVLRCVAVFCLCYAFIRLVRIDVGGDFANFILSCLCIFCFTLIAIYFIGLSRKETDYFIGVIKNRIRAKK
ncbi:MAG: oligosaccharide flippase family protein [Prevotella sp.]|nr:oligosaccharide flippase family protein [Prevotella sp.]